MTTKVTMIDVPCQRCEGLATTTVTTRHLGLEKLCDACATNVRRDGQEVVAAYSDAVQQAFRDWNEHRAYVDNGGNYRVRPEAATPTHRPAGKIAPWNREAKRLFPSSAEFHTAARKSLQQVGQGAKTTTKGNDNSAIIRDC